MTGRPTHPGNICFIQFGKQRPETYKPSDSHCE